MGPLFSLAMIIVTAAILTAAIFIAAVFFLPWRLALRMAGAAVIGGGIGFVSTIIALSAFNPGTISSRAEGISIFGPALIAGMAGALICARMIFQLSRRDLKPPRPS